MYTNKWARTKGFTVVELLIVIVVVGILAAITIMSYAGISDRAIETSMKSDLRGAATNLEAEKIYDGSYPVTTSDANNGTGLPVSTGNSYVYSTNPAGYCLEVVNGTKRFHIKSTIGSITSGACTVAVATYAGSATAGYLDGDRTTARFNNISGVAFDNADTLYVSDRDNHRIRKITPDGTVSTFAGSGVSGFCTAGTGTAARIATPGGITTDDAGNVYALATSSCVVRITPAGVMTIIGGAGGYGYLDGPAAGSQFRNPSSVAVDAAGNVYVADRSNHRIRMITPGGTVSTFAGSGTNGTANGTGTAAQFSYPDSITIDRQAGIMYVSDLSHRIRKITLSTAVVSPHAGSTEGYADGNGTSAQFSYPTSIGVDSTGNVYVAEQDNSHRIRKIAPNGDVTTVAGNGTAGNTNGTGTEASFYYPAGIAVDSDGVVYTGSSPYIRSIQF